MARYTGFWAPIPRKFIDISNRDPIKRALILTLFCWANTKESEAPDGRKTVLLIRGQLKTSYQELSLSIGCDPRTVKTLCEKLAKDGHLDIATAYRGVIITIKDYVPLKKKRVKKGQKAGSHNVVDSCVHDVCDKPSETKVCEDGVFPPCGSFLCPRCSRINKFKELKNFKEPPKGGDTRARETDLENVEFPTAEEPPFLENGNLIEIRKQEIQKRREEIWAKFDSGDQDLSPEENLEIETLEKELVEINKPETNKNTPPKPEIDLTIEWHWEASRMRKTNDFEVSKYKQAIDEILDTTTHTKQDLRRLFEFLKSSKDNFLTLKGAFRYPWQWKDRWGSYPNKLEATFCEMNMKKQWRERL